MLGIPTLLSVVLVQSVSSQKNARPLFKKDGHSGDKHLYMLPILTSLSAKVKAISCDLAKKLDKYTPKELFTMVGVLNEILYCAARNVEVIVKDSAGKRIFNRKNLSALLNAPTVDSPARYIAKYLKKFWAGIAYYSINAAMWFREVLSQEFQLFTLEKRDWTDPKNRHRKPNPCGQLNVLKALLLVEQCEIRLKEHYKLDEVGLDWSQEIGNGNYPMVRDESKSFPKHKWYVLVRLHRMILGPVATYCRNDDEFTPQDELLLPLAVQAIENEYLALQAEEKLEQAEQQLDELMGDNPGADEQKLLAQPMEIIESETVQSGGIAVVVSRVAKVIPLAAGLIRCCMWVLPAPRPKKPEKVLDVPCSVLEQSETALDWWKERIEHSGLWLSEMAPNWVWDAVLPF